MSDCPPGCHVNFNMILLYFFHELTEMLYTLGLIITLLRYYENTKKSTKTCTLMVSDTAWKIFLAL